MSLLAILLSYLIGSIPFGYLAGRMVRYIDIRAHGSGNIGATNVTRVMGLKWGVVVFIADLVKGVFGPLLVGLLTVSSHPSLYLLAGIAAVAGHNWPIFLGFRGGKGVSTSLGAVIGICVIFPPMFISLGCALVVWLGLFFLKRIVSIASLAAAAVFFVSALFIPVPVELKIFSGVLCAFIILRHKSNILNLLQKREFRF